MAMHKILVVAATALFAASLASLVFEVIILHPDDCLPHHTCHLSQDSHVASSPLFPVSVLYGSHLTLCVE